VPEGHGRPRDAQNWTPVRGVRLAGFGHANVEMQLLGIRRAGPARRDPFGDPLESQLAKAGLGTDDHPAAGVFVDCHPQHLAVEPGESGRVGAVDHCLFQAPDHTHSMSACQRRSLALAAELVMHLARREPCQRARWGPDCRPRARSFAAQNAGHNH